MANIFSNIWNTIKSIPEQYKAMGQYLSQNIDTSKLTGSLSNIQKSVSATPTAQHVGDTGYGLSSVIRDKPYTNPITQQSVMESYAVINPPQSQTVTNPFTQQSYNPYGGGSTSSTYYQPSVTTGGTTTGGAITGGTPTTTGGTTYVGASQPYTPAPPPPSPQAAAEFLMLQFLILQVQEFLILHLQQVWQELPLTQDF